jgi:chromate transporter
MSRRRKGDVSDHIPISLGDLFWIFFRIACTSFGGFMAMISMVENVVVQRRKLLSSQDMLDGVSLASILPGPMAVNVVAYVGYRLRGWIGAAVSALAAILPAFVLVVLLSIAYFRWGQIPAISKLFLGFIPAVAAIIAVTAWNMGRKAIVGPREAALAVSACLTLVFIGGFFSTLAIVAIAAAVGWFCFRTVASTPSVKTPSPRRKRRRSIHAMRMFAAPPVFLVAPLLAFDPGLLIKLFLVFSGMGLLLFGGAYVFIPVIQESIVNGYGWVTQQEFVDAVALGQITPGPILVSAAFIGLKVAGLAGAVAASAGIFLPAAGLMVFCTRLLERIKTSAGVNAALRGVRPAVVGMIFAAVITIGKTASPVWVSAFIFVTTLIALLRFRLEAVWIVPLAGLLGLMLY